MGIDPNACYPKLRQRILEADAAARRSRQAPKLESPAGIVPLGTPQVEATNTKRFLVRVTGFRHVLLDEDNLAEKYHVDCCRYAGLLPLGDGPETTHIQVSQEKVPWSQPEFTRIEVTEYAS